MKKFLVFIMLLVICVPCSAADKFSAVCNNGTFNGVLSSDNVITWLGVPYAKPPVGSLRWKAPEAPEASTETFEADTLSAMPIQRIRDTNLASLMPQDEDCLYLNVWKASDDTAASRPVMVWIHGGSFRSNGTGEPEWLGHKLAADNPDIMVVSVGYRLGLMGFIDFSEVSGGENFAESGNLGILDVLQSLKWLKDNVAAFGGDPDNITLFGQSSGSALLSLLMTIPEAQGLFQRAILQSGSVSMSMAKEDSTQLAKELLELTGKADMAGLMALTSTDLQNAATKLDGALNFPERDGVVLSEDVYAAFAANAGNYDVLIGSDADEVRYFLGAVGSLDLYGTYVSSVYEQLTDVMSQIPNYGEAMVDAAESFIALQGDVEPVWAYTEFINELLFRGPAIQMASSSGRTGNTYMYYWNIPTAAPYLACHGIELPFIFDIPGALLPSDFLNSTQGQSIRALVQNMWVDFAKDGVIDGMTQYNATDRATIIVSPDAMPISVLNDPLSEQRQLISPLLALNFSGREIINLVNAGGADKDADDNNGDSSGGGSTAVMPVLSISSQTLNLTAGQEMTPFTITATAGDNLRWSTGGTLPEGLTGTAASGGLSFTISGTPAVTTVGQNFSYEVTATNSEGSALATITINIAGITVAPVAANVETPSQTAQNVVKKEAVAQDLINALFSGGDIPAGVGSEIEILNDDNSTKNATNLTATELENLFDNAGATLTLSEDNPVVLESIQVTEAKIYMFAVPKSNLTAGEKIFLHLLKNAFPVVNGSAFTADSGADEVEEAVFMDDSGNIINTVPDGLDVNIVAYMEPNNIYTPVITSAQDNGNGNENLGGSGGGCNAGIFSLIFLLPIVPLRLKSRD